MQTANGRSLAVVESADKVQSSGTRWVGGDQIEVFQITHGMEGLDSGMFFLI